MKNSPRPDKRAHQTCVNLVNDLHLMYLLYQAKSSHSRGTPKLLGKEDHSTN